jgi:predicted TIM-barrel fold metal-dependent hydrolase
MADTDRPNIIDVDIHERADTHDLLPHLDPKFRHYIEQAGWVPDRALPFAQLTVGGLDRADAKTPDGRPGGSDLGMMQEQLLDEYDHEYGVLTGWLNAGALHPGWSEFKTALMTAYNDWQIENWLDKEERLVGSINIRSSCPRP